MSYISSLKVLSEYTPSEVLLRTKSFAQRYLKERGVSYPVEVNQDKVIFTLDIPRKKGSCTVITDGKNLDFEFNYEDYYGSNQQTYGIDIKGFKDYSDFKKTLESCYKTAYKTIFD